MTAHIPVSDMTRPVAVLDRSSLARAVALATLTVDRKNTIPILSNLRLRGDGESLSVIGTDLDCEIIARVAGAADSRLDVTVPAHMLKDILGKAKDSELASLDDASTDESYRCGVDLGGVKFNLNSLPATDYPEMEAVGSDCKTTDFEVEPDVLVDLFSKVKFCQSTEETRYYLNGVFFHSPERSGKLRTVATDGHRMAVMEVEAPAGSADFSGAIVPRRAVGILLDILKVMRKPPGILGPVTVSVEPRRIAFCIGSVRLTSKLIDGTFPDYERVVPRHGDKATVAVKSLVDAVTQVSLISPEKGKAVKLDFTGTGLTVSQHNADTGFSETTISCESEKPLTIGFNSRYLLDVAGHIGAESMYLSLNDAGSPMVVFDPADARFKAVLMPMRI